MYKFTFITGAGRCGTNLILGLLDGHSKLDVVNGQPTDLLGKVLHYNGRSSKVNIEYSFDPLNYIFLSGYLCRSDYISIKDRIESRIGNLKLESKLLPINILLSNMCSALFQKESGRAVISLQNENIGGLLDAFPDCKVIHMIRNPFTQLNSRYLNRYRTPCNYRSGEFGRAFIRNQISFSQAEIFQHHQQVMIVKMEELQNDTKKIINEVVRFLGINIESINFNTSENGKQKKYISNGKTISYGKVYKVNQDWTCLTPNDLYWCSQIISAKSFYEINEFPFKKNNYFIFLMRHLGFKGNHRKLFWNPAKILKLILGSMYLYIQDIDLKREFFDFSHLGKNHLLP